MYGQLCTYIVIIIVFFKVLKNMCGRLAAFQFSDFVFLHISLTLITPLLLIFCSFMLAHF